MLIAMVASHNLWVIGPYTLTAQQEERKFLNSPLHQEYDGYRRQTGHSIPPLRFMRATPAGPGAMPVR